MRVFYSLFLARLGTRSIDFWPESHWYHRPGQHRGHRQHPDDGQIQAEIETIERERDQIPPAANLQARQMNESIQSLLCIEHNPE